MLVERPYDAELHNALGLVTAADGQRQGVTVGEQARRVVGYFQRAAQYDPGNVMAGLNLVEALAVLGQLNATANWHRIVKEIVFGGPPGSQLGEQEAEFWDDPRRAQAASRQLA